MKNIKERLMNGESAEAILKELSSQVANAEREIERENRKKALESEKLSKARGAFVDSVVNYLKALGAIKETDDTTVAKEMLYKILKESEGEVKMYSQMLDKFGSMSTPIMVPIKPAVTANSSRPKSDEVLRDFLKKSLY